MIKSRTGIKLRPITYQDFQGIDTSRDIRSLDSGNKQHFSMMENCYADWRGQIVIDKPAVLRNEGPVIKHIRFFNSNEACWVSQYADGLKLESERDHSTGVAYPANANVTTAIFNRNTMFFAPLLDPYEYNGTIFSKMKSRALLALRPSFGASIQRRLAVAGIPSKPSEIHFSRVDNQNIFPDDEQDEETSILRAGYIDIANYMNTADDITGLAPFEQNRLAIFTTERTLIFKIDPDIEQWTIDDRTQIAVGCISHNTIVQAGNDTPSTIFCSRSGVYQIARSSDNGILVHTNALSYKVQEIYQELLRSVDDEKSISAVFDNNLGQYHIFFPQSGGVLTKRLTLTVNNETGKILPKWSTGNFLNTRCGDYLNGQLLFGTSGGIYINQDHLRASDDAVWPTMEVVTPVFWCGSMTEIKESHSIIIQASGEGLMRVEATDEEGKDLGSFLIEINESADDNRFLDVPLSQQYERRFSHRYKGVQFKITVEGAGLVRVDGLAIMIRKP